MTEKIDVVLLPGQSPFDALVDALDLPQVVADEFEDWILMEIGQDAHSLDLESLVVLAERFEEYV